MRMHLIPRACAANMVVAWWLVVSQQGCRCAGPWHATAPGRASQLLLLPMAPAAPLHKQCWQTGVGTVDHPAQVRGVWRQSCAGTTQHVILAAVVMAGG